MWATDRHEVCSAFGREAAFFAACALASAPDRAACARERLPAAGLADRPALMSLDFAPAARALAPAPDAPVRGATRPEWPVPEALVPDAAEALVPGPPVPGGRLPDVTPAAATPATVPASATATPAATARPRGPGRRQRFLADSLPGPAS
jgi:hypothetical protein